MKEFLPPITFYKLPFYSHQFAETAQGNQQIFPRQIHGSFFVLIIQFRITSSVFPEVFPSFWILPSHSASWQPSFHAFSGYFPSPFNFHFWILPPPLPATLSLTNDHPILISFLSFTLSPLIRREEAVWRKAKRVLTTLRLLSLSLVFDLSLLSVQLYMEALPDIQNLAL